MSARIASAFDAALRQQGSTLTPEDLLEKYAPSSTPATPADDAPLPPLALAECRFYEDFAASPADANEKAQRAVQAAIQAHGQAYVDAILDSHEHHALRRHRSYDFRLNEQEAARLAALGFVVSERLRAPSFAEIYYRLYSDDLPVYVTSDSVLHAWHRSFDAFLVDLEEQQLAPLLTNVLDDVLAASDRKPASVQATPVFEQVQTFFRVAHRLLVAGDNLDVDADASVATVLTAIRKEQLTTVAVFGSPRQVDFSLFKPRGHYAKTQQLANFFRAMSWLGTVDFRVDGTDDDPAADLHQLRCACLAVELLRDAAALQRVDAFHTIVSAITGDGPGADSMTPVQLDALLGDRDLAALYAVSEDGDTSPLRALQDEIANRGLGAQAIAGHPLTESAAAAASPCACTRLQTSFAVLGPQFVWSAFVFSKLVFDQVLHRDEQVARRLPSAVDAAFALFGNDAAGREIVARMTASSQKDHEDFVPFRDGLMYASNAVALRQFVDAQLVQAETSTTTTSSLALLWQLALRELSRAPTSAGDARVFKSEAWQRRQMNTQLASLAQLRHDTVLYAKQSFTMGTRCEYATGFVDPYPAFWRRMQQLAERARELLTLVARVATHRSSSGDRDDEDESPLQYKARVFFGNFADVMRQLVEISTAQAAARALSEEQVDFLKSVIEERRGSGATRYLGWYPSLFYVDREDSGKQDHLVADIHTDVPSAEHGDPGGILHLGVGDVNLGVFVVDKVTYAGPVFSHYEFVTPINKRLTDDAFSARLGSLSAPSWARESFLVAAASGAPRRDVDDAPPE